MTDLFKGPGRPKIPVIPHVEETEKSQLRDSHMVPVTDTGPTKQDMVAEAMEKIRSLNIFEMLEGLNEENHLMALQAFQNALAKDPPTDILEKDRGFWTLPISYVESLLDAYFLGQWSIISFTWEVVSNEIIGYMSLEVVNPITQRARRLSGTASVQIMVDALSREDRQGMNKRDINAHYLDVNNKKPNSLETVFPKLEAMCMKSAAKKLGKLFGRDINRKHVSEPTQLIEKKQIINQLINKYGQESKEREGNS